MREVVSTDKAPAALGAYSQAIKASGNFVFTAGQIPLIPGTDEMRNDNIQEAAEQALKNLKAVLEEAGSGMEHVVKTTVFLADISEFVDMNAVYTSFFPQNPPARSALQVAELPKGARIEIEAVALIP